ncbi:MAG: porin [Betaproteobacteria bacterium]|nr:porin [Betaproteobacteria bacterium]
MELKNARPIFMGVLLAAAAFSSKAAPGLDRVEAYGLIDLGITTLNHSEPFDPVLGTIPLINRYATQRVTGLVSGNLQTSRIGFRGKEDLGNGTAALFVLESHINANNGTLGTGAATSSHTAGAFQTGDSSCQGQLFCRQTWVGLQGDWGTLGFGRQYAFTYDIIRAYDPFGSSNSLDGLGRTQQGGGNTRDVRIDNSLKFTRHFGPFNLGAEYGFGGVAGNFAAGAFTGTNAGYETGLLGIQAAWQRKADSQIWAPSSAFANAVYDTDTQTILLAIKYRLDNLLLQGGHERVDLNAGSNHLCLPTAASVCGANEKLAGQQTVIWYGGITWFATDRLSLVGAAYNQRRGPYQMGVNSQSGGQQWDLSAMADYRCSVKTDIYLGTHSTWLLNSLAYGYANTDFNLVTMGIRHRF